MGFKFNVGGGGPGLSASKSTYYTSIAQGALIASLTDPFGSGATYTVVGNTPSTLALASGGRIVAGAGAQADGQASTIVIRASKGSRAVEESLTFTSIPIPRAATYPKAGDLVFGLSPYRTQGNSLTALAYPPSSGALNEVSDNFMPAQPAGWRPVYFNFGLNSADSSGPTALETLPGNANTIDGSVTFTAANGGGTRVAGTFNGAASVVIPDGGFAIEDARPAFAGGFHRVSLTTPSGGKRPTGWNADPAYGEYRRRNGAFASSNLAGGQITGSAPDNLRGYKPHGVVVPFDGRTPSVLFIADSIGAQNDQRPDARQLVGGIVKALGDPAGIGSFGVANFTHHGASMEDFMDVTAGSNRFSQRYAALAAIRDMNGGRWPITHIWSQGLRNDFSAMASSATPDDVLVLMKARAQAWWDFLAKTFPGIPIIQSTVSSRVTNDSVTNYTLLEGQLPRPAAAGIGLENFNTWLVQTVPAPLAMVVDLQDGQRELRADPNFSGQSPVWGRLAFVKAGGGKLATALAAGVATSTVKITASTPPAVGSAAYFEPGTSVMEMKGSINTVTDNGDGSFTLGLSASITPSNAHAVGSVFATSPTTDGTHPETVVHEIWASMVRPLKPLIASL
ncbi:hypothetical protein [Sphingomonas sp. Leaf257]|uniref:hypothetical protein n=1 Tax=Sphingomonas sp. Leaf257 TaxID=1736309 RepID=UPI000700A15F|nr:hypothetical protein [Sphingomonas sp. Leaf257]KQO50434.1 hypothetical protein ASF14_09950 [Sphingomonas sp. Leaf257]